MTRIFATACTTSLLFAVSCRGDEFLPTRRRQLTIAGLGPRGGGIFSRAVDVADQKSAQLSAMAKKKAAELDNKAEKLAHQARKQAEKEQKRLEKEARRLAKEAEKAARNKSAEIERATRKKAAEYEKAARKKAAEVSAAMTRATRSTFDSVQDATNKRVADLEKSVTGLLGEVDKKLDALDKISVESSFFEVESKKKSTAIQILDKPSKVALVILVVMGSITSVMNLVGQPSMVIDHWENTVFGEKFFAILNLDVTSKRILAGVMELVAVLMMMTSNLRRYGAALMGIMYTRGAVINAEIEKSKGIIIGLAAALALLVFGNEVASD